MSEENNRILVITQYIYPENFKSNELVFELAKRGHWVDVLTGIPNYPEGVYYKGYGLLKRRVETVNGVHFYRCIQTPRGRKASGVGLAVNYMSFVFFSFFWIVFFFAWKKRYDAIITHEPSPITQIIPAIILSKLRKVPVYSWIMDIWPDAMKNSVSPRMYKMVGPPLRGITRWIYKNSHKLLITSKGFEALINREGDFSDKIIYYPNWSIDLKAIPTNYSIPLLPDGFIIMLAGNLGEAQNLDAVGEAMLLLKDVKEVKWIFVGDGSWKKWLDDFIAEKHLEETAFTLGRFPGEAMATFYQKADAMLITLRGGFIDLDMTVPARMQSYMSAGRPVLGMIGPGVQGLIEESDCGYAVPAGDYQALVGIIQSKILTNREAFEAKGANGRNYFEKEFTLDHCINHIEEIIREK